MDKVFSGDLKSQELNDSESMSMNSCLMSSIHRFPKSSHKAKQESFQGHEVNKIFTGDNITPPESPIVKVKRPKHIPNTSHSSHFYKNTCEASRESKSDSSSSCQPCNVSFGSQCAVLSSSVGNKRVLDSYTRKSDTPTTSPKSQSKSLTISLSNHEATILDAIMGLREDDNSEGRLSSSINDEIKSNDFDSNDNVINNCGGSTDKKYKKSSVFMDSITKHLCDLSWKGCPSRCRYQCWCLLCRYITPQQLQLTTQQCQMTHVCSQMKEDGLGRPSSGMAQQKQDAAERHKLSVLFNTLNHFEHPQRLKKVHEYHALVRQSYDSIPWGLLLGQSKYNMDSNISWRSASSLSSLGNDDVPSSTLATSNILRYSESTLMCSPNNNTSETLETSVNGLLQKGDYNHREHGMSPLLYEGLSVVFGSNWDPHLDMNPTRQSQSDEIDIKKTRAPYGAKKTSDEWSCRTSLRDMCVLLEGGVSTGLSFAESDIYNDRPSPIPKWISVAQEAINEEMSLSTVPNTLLGQYKHNACDLMLNNQNQTGAKSDVTAAAITMLLSSIVIPTVPLQSTEKYLLSWKEKKTAKVLHVINNKQNKTKQCNSNSKGISGELQIEPSLYVYEARRHAKALISTEDMSTMQQIRRDVPRTTSFGANISHFADPVNFPMVSKVKQQLRHSNNNIYRTDTSVKDTNGYCGRITPSPSPSLSSQCIPNRNSCVLLKHPYVMALMERVLYLWALRHPASGYVQGMNDLVLPFLLTVFAEALCFSGTTAKNQQDTYAVYKEEKDKETNLTAIYNQHYHLCPVFASEDQSTSIPSHKHGDSTNQCNTTVYTVRYNHLPEVGGNGDLELQWLLDIPNMDDLNELMVRRGLLHCILVKEEPCTVDDVMDRQTDDAEKSPTRIIRHECGSNCSGSLCNIVSSRGFNSTDHRRYCYVLTPTPLWIAVEADIFFLFSKLMDSLQENYTEVAMKDEHFGRGASLTKHKDPIVGTGGASNQVSNRLSVELIPSGTTAGAMFSLVHKLEQVVRKADPLLHSFITDFLSIPFTYFGFKWMTCMGLRELPTMVGLRIWDTYMAENDSVFWGAVEEGRRSWCVGVVSSSNEVEKQRENAKSKTLFSSCLTFHVYFSAALLINIYGTHLAKIYAEKIANAARARKKMKLENELRTLTAERKNHVPRGRKASLLEGNQQHINKVCDAELDDLTLTSDSDLDCSFSCRQAESVDSDALRRSSENVVTLFQQEADILQSKHPSNLCPIVGVVAQQGLQDKSSSLATVSMSSTQRVINAFSEGVLESNDKTSYTKSLVENSNLAQEENVIDENSIPVEIADCERLEEDVFFDKVAFVGDAMKVLQGPAPFPFLFEAQNSPVGGFVDGNSGTSASALIERSTGELLSQAFLLQQLLEDSQAHLAKDTSNPSTNTPTRLSVHSCSSSFSGMSQVDEGFLSSVRKRLNNIRDSGQDKTTQSYHTGSSSRDSINSLGSYFYGIPLASSSEMYYQPSNSSDGSVCLSDVACVSQGYVSVASCGSLLSSVTSSFASSLNAAMRPYSQQFLDNERRISSRRLSKSKRGTGSSSSQALAGSSLGPITRGNNLGTSNCDSGTHTASLSASKASFQPSVVTRQSSDAKKWLSSLFTKKEKKK